VLCFGEPVVAEPRQDAPVESLLRPSVRPHEELVWSTEGVFRRCRCASSTFQVTEKRRDRCGVGLQGAGAAASFEPSISLLAAGTDHE
jgi:hypothetical protein